MLIIFSLLCVGYLAGASIQEMMAMGRSWLIWVHFTIVILFIMCFGAWVLGA